MAEQARPAPSAAASEDPAPAALTGIDYLQLVTDADTAALGEQLNRAALDDGGDGGHGGQRQEKQEER